MDLTERTRANAPLDGENHILEMVAKGAALPDILDSLCRIVEQEASGVLASILLLDGNRLRHGGAPSLPTAYTDAIDGALIGPSAGSCGTAAYHGRQVIVEDIASDPLWADYRALALPHSLGACWSTPVFSSQGHVIATFAMYYREPRTPSQRDQQVITQITHLAGVAIERHLTHERLQRSEAYLADAQALTHTGSFVWDVRTKHALHLSDEWYRIFEFDREKGAGVFAERWHRVCPDDRVRWQAAIDRAITERSGYELEARLVVPRGATKHVRVVAHPVLDGAGDVVQFIGSVMDITERKHADEEREKLRALEANLAHINRVSILGEFAASLAHEIRQPIAAAMIDANLCLRRLSDDRLDVQAARNAASRLVKAATRLDEIIKHTTALYKRDTTQRAPVNVNVVIREMVVLLRQEAGASSISIRTELGEGIPDILADRVQLQQVFMNLMLNAIDAMKDTGGTLAITSHMSDKRELIVAVSDTGVGLPRENPERIFESFVTTKPHGTGMGLAITRSIVESHGGRVWAAANAGPGATFVFTLPSDVGAAHEP